MKKTKKEFTPYNDYVDRPFDLKWPTAFPLGELQAAIKETDENLMHERLKDCHSNLKYK